MRCASTGSQAASASSSWDDHCGPSGTTHAEAGFTLLEVLVALTVLALSMTVFYPAFSASVRGLGRIDGHLAARQIATGLVEENSLSRAMKPGSTQGRDGVHRWRLTIAPSTEDLVPLSIAGDWKLFEVTATVDWPPQNRFQLTTYQLGKAR